MTNSLKKVLMERDGLTELQAIQDIEEAKKELQDYLAEGEGDIQDFLEERFGLEPDYALDLL